MSTTTHRTRYSETERKAWREQIRALVKRVADMPAEHRAALAAQSPIVTCEGHPLSPYNTVYLLMQGATTATIVAGFRQWRKAGRHVRAGEKAAGYIYVPTFSKTEDGSEDGEPDTTVRFRLVPVFDVAQTDEGAEVAA